MTLDWKLLLDPKGPFVSFTSCNEGALDDFVTSAPEFTAAVVRIVRGKRCTSRERLFQEWAAALQFPSYFGENWDAFEECLSDLEWLPAGGFVLFITRADQVLELAPDEDLNTLADILVSAAKTWRSSHPIAPFHLVFHAEPQDETKARQRLAVAGLISESRE
jgi:hypothetical protein